MNGKLPAHDILPLTHAIAQEFDFIFESVAVPGCYMSATPNANDFVHVCQFPPGQLDGVQLQRIFGLFPCYKARSRGCFLLVHTWLRASDILSDIRSQAPRGCLSGRAGICESALNIIAATAIRVSDEFHIPSSEEEARHASPLVFV